MVLPAVKSPWLFGGCWVFCSCREDIRKQNKVILDWTKICSYFYSSEVVR